MRLILALSVAFAVTAHAAEATRVASSFEPNDPFGMFLDIGFDRVQDKGKIVREWYQEGAAQDVTELRYSLYKTAMPLDLHIGIFRDVELHVGVPIVFQEDRYWGFASGTDSTNSTIYRNCSDTRGNVCATPGLGSVHLFDVGNPTASYRSGLGDFSFGVSWAPYNQKKDDTKPTWVLRFEYTAPTASLLNPTTATTSAARGNIGEKVHRYSISTAVSKKLWFAEPYFQLHYTLPYAAGGVYSNCDNPSDDRLGRAENCGKSGWAHGDTGIRPAHVGGIFFGTELTVFERADRFQRVAFDLRAFWNYTSEGRYYNEMSDLFGKLLYNSDYATVGGQIGFVGQAAEFVSLKANASIAYNTERYLTMENVGKDFNGNGTVDISTSPEEINPNYDFRVDRPGRRFRMEEQFVFRVQVTASFNF